MNMIKNINKIPSQIFDAFEKNNPEFLIVGIKKRNTPGGQPQYEQFGNYCPDYGDMLNFLASDSIARFKVFQIGEVFSNEGTLREAAKNHVAEQVEKREREQYEKLKAKFEPITT